jgi:hypothetical protein
MSLPIFPDMSEPEIERVIECVLEVTTSNRKKVWVIDEPAQSVFVHESGARAERQSVVNPLDKRAS